MCRLLFTSSKKTFLALNGYSDWSWEWFGGRMRSHAINNAGTLVSFEQTSLCTYLGETFKITTRLSGLTPSSAFGKKETVVLLFVRGSMQKAQSALPARPHFFDNSILNRCRIKMGRNASRGRALRYGVSQSFDFSSCTLHFKCQRMQLFMALAIGVRWLILFAVSFTKTH